MRDDRVHIRVRARTHNIRFVCTLILTPAGISFTASIHMHRQTHTRARAL
jgi:hypothetical protein